MFVLLFHNYTIQRVYSNVLTRLLKNFHHYGASYYCLIPDDIITNVHLVGTLITVVWERFTIGYFHVKIVCNNTFSSLG